ncbi:SPOR domain-containing protein [Aliifodinibius sp. S!AR15-10]|uniref:SPOR domain-containing protein n=1 Tax=Aliifodinibius sp. S!AR15-10 TaxID=2950437 RepID=UPI002863F691|nr:SPOR domain-containing protein [Aliifodinibius sp. S!AR15-10]MDR8394219.1 SPOR domain-containing protein [Aliifodinibius sp. S!AR15-10]
MKINKQQLVELLVKKTGLEQQEVEQKLSELITQIQETTEQNKTFSIEKFGSFRMEEGVLKFEPTEELKTEVNNKYAGMEPIEMIGAYKEAEDEHAVSPADAKDESHDETGGGQDSGTEEQPNAREHEQEETLEEEDIWGIKEEQEDTAEASIEEEQELDRDTESESEPEQGAPADEEVASSGMDEEESLEEEIFDTDLNLEQEEPEEEGEETDTEPVTAEAAPEEEVVPEQKKSATTVKGVGLRGKDRKRKRNSSTAVIMIAAAAVIIIAVAVWLAYDMGVLSGGTGSGSSSNTDSQVAVATQRDEQPGQSDQTAETAGAGQVGNQQESNETSGSESNQQSDAGQQQGSSETMSGSEPETENTVASGGGDQSGGSTYGLKGKIIEEANDGYTIIVHSLKDQQDAREIYADFKEQGYRTHIVSAMVNGQERWRVGLGQFKTIEEAQSNAKELPEPHNKDFFIKRIK